MAKYTVEVRSLVEWAESQGGSHYEQGRFTEKSWRILGLDSYPIFDEKYRNVLNAKIIGRFYFREIGAETPAQFAWFMRQRMLEKMPYYNQLYLSLDAVKDPMSSRKGVTLETWGTDTDNATTSNTKDTSESKTDSSNVFSDTPMSMLSNEGSPSVKGLDYATSVTYDDVGSKASNVGDAKGTSKTKQEGTRKVETSGRDVPEADLLKKWRDTFINVDEQVMKELDDLFFLLW